MSETPEHNRIKNIVTKKLKEWYGASIPEYLAEGHKADSYAVTKDGRTIFVEVIWTPSKENFFRDLNLIQQSDANIKLVIANPKLLFNGDFQREFEKLRISQTRHGYVVSNLVDGSRILNEPNYAEKELRSVVDGLLQSYGGLQIVFDPTSRELLGEYKYERIDLIRRVARAEIWNHGSQLAKRVNALLFVEKGVRSMRPVKLHFAFTDETESEPRSVDIERGSYKIVDVVFSQPSESEISQYPGVSLVGAGTSGSSYLATTPGTVSASLVVDQSQRPPVTIRPFEAHEDGCYAATNDALRWPKAYPQFHLQSGEYLISVGISAENFSSASAKFKLKSPTMWHQLAMDNIISLQSL